MNNARRGLNLLLERYPHSDLREAAIPGAMPASWEPWLLVTLDPGSGRPHLRFAIWQRTGAVYERDGDGAVGDDPFLEPCNEPEPNSSAANGAICELAKGHDGFHAGRANGPAAAERPGQHVWQTVSVR